MSGLEPYLIPILAPVGKKLLEKLLDKGADKGADALIGMVEGLAHATKDNPNLETEAAKAQAALEQQGVPPSQAAKVVERITGVAMLSPEQQDLHALWAYLRFILESVEELRRPIALPGFLTGKEWVVVIDARCEDSGAKPVLPDDPTDNLFPSKSFRLMPHPMKRTFELEPRRTDGRRRGRVETTPDPEITMLEQGFPRIWFFEQRTASSRAAVVKRMEADLRRRATCPEPADLPRYVAAKAKTDVKLLDAVDSAWVYPFIRRPANDDRLRSVASPFSGTGAEQFPIDEDDMAGFDTMRDALNAALKEQKKTQRAKHAMMKPSAKPKPATREPKKTADQ